MYKVLLITSLVSISFFADNLNTASMQMIAYGMEENKLILQSIGATVSNYGDEQDKKLYKRCIQHYVESQILYIESDFGKAYKQTRHTQKLLIGLYETMLEKNIQLVRNELIGLGGISRGKEKKETTSFLRLGFRALETAEQKLIFAKNTRPQLYLLKLREMLFSLKILKEAGRFVILLGLLHDSDYDTDIYETDFTIIKHNIRSSISKQTEKYLRLHHDSHFMSLHGEGIFNEVWGKPDLEELSQPLPGIDNSYIRHDNIKKSKN